MRLQREAAASLLGYFALGFVRRVVDLCLEAFEQSGQKRIGVSTFILKLMRERDVAGEIGEDDAPREGVFPGAAANADVLALFGDPDAHNLEGCLVTLCDWWNA
jgi:hypothetical protein